MSEPDWHFSSANKEGIFLKRALPVWGGRLVTELSAIPLGLPIVPHCH